MSYLYSDNRIALIRYHIEPIFEKCFGVKDAIVSQRFFEPLEPTMYRLCQDDATIERFDELIPAELKFNETPNWPEPIAQLNTDENAQSEEVRAELARDSALVIIHMIGQHYTSCFYPQMRIVALEMIQKISVYLPFETRLGIVLPYVAKIFDSLQVESNPNWG